MHTLSSARTYTGSMQLYTLLAALALLLTGNNLFAQITDTYSYTGSTQTFTVPTGVTSVSVKVWGAGGAGSLYTGAGYAGSGGSGALVKGTIAVTPGQTLTIVVGGGGRLSVTAASAGGYGGGGASGGAYGGSGGGYSGIFSSATLSQANALAIAGGGAGGGYYYQTTYGGAGGATTGSAGGNVTTTYTGGGGGTVSAGGAGGRFNNTVRGSAGTALTGGGGAVYAVGGGGGGGGYYGGGGGYGAAATSAYYSSGGGGGSSYLGSMTTTTNTAGTISATAVATQAPGSAESGYVAGSGNGGSGSVSTTASSGNNGLVTITYNPPGCSAPTAQPTALSLVSTATATATASIAGSFTAATTVPSGYIILRSTSATAPTLTNGTGYATGATTGSYYVVRGTTAPATTTTFTDTGLSSNTTYYYYIASFSSGCTGQPYYLTTGILTGNTNSCAAAPTAPSVTTGSDQATFSWTAAATGGGAGSYTYTLELSTSASFTSVTSYPGVTSGYTVTGLAAGTYYYRLKANNGSCDSVYTNGGAFTICASFNSAINIGGTTVPGSQYATLTEALTALANCGITQATTLYLNSSYTSSAETFPITIPVISGSSATNTLTIKPRSGVTASISGAVASGALIKVLNSYTIIDGSNTAGGTSLDLTITNTSATGPFVMVVGSTGTTPITNVTVKNTNIINGVNTSAAFILSDGTTPGNAGYFSDITIQNNSVQKAYVGLYVNAVAGVATNGKNLLIKDNALNLSGANAITGRAIYVAGVDGTAEITGNYIGNITSAYTNDTITAIFVGAGTNNLTIDNNTIAGITSTATTTTAYGIYLNTGTTNAATVIKNNSISAITSAGQYINADTGIMLAGDSPNITIDANRIFNIKHVGGYAVSGIYLYGTSAAANTTISNNMIWDIAGVGSTASAFSNGHGIFVFQGAGYKIYNNSINMNTDQASGITSALYVYTSVTAAGALDVRNNIFANTQTVNSRYAIYSAVANTVFSNIDYNDYYTAGTALGYIGSDRVAFADVQTGFGSNTHSVSISPSFVSPTDLHLNMCTSLEGTGTLLLATDFDGDARNGGATEIGADELYGVIPPAITSVTGATICGSGAGTLAATATSGIDGFRWYTAASGGSYVTTTTGSYTATVSATTIFYVTTYNSTCESDFRTPVTLTVSPAAPAPVVSPSSAQGCPGTVHTLTVSNAVTNGTPLTQNFTGVATGALPAGWTKVQPTTTTVWGVMTGATAGGTTPEMAINCASSTTTETGQYILNAPVVNLTGLSSVVLSQKHRLSHYSATYAYTLRIQASADNTNWTTLWSLTPTASVTATTLNVDLSSFSGQPAVYIRYMLEGLPFGCNYWDLDDITVTGTLPSYTWAPTTGLYTDIAATTAYTGGNATTLYANPTETSTYTVITSLGSCTTTGTVGVTLVSEWTGATNTDWFTATNWCGNVVPVVTNNVVIPDVTNLPVIGSGTAYAHNLTIGEDATLNVSTGATLHVDNILAVNPLATLTVDDNGALLQGDGTVNNANTGNIIFHKKGSSLYRLDYTLWSSPVTEQDLALFSPATSSNRFYEYKTLTDQYGGVTASGTDFDTAKGYLIRMPNAHSASGYNDGSSPIQFDGIFTGAPGNGTVTKTLSTDGNRYSAVGNPYPSPINVSDFFAGNSTVIDGTSGIYLWRKKNNGSSSSYATLTLAAFVANPAIGGGSDNNGYYVFDETTGSDNWLLAPAQGFIVRALNIASPQLTFTNAMRRPTPGTAQSFFRQGAQRASRVWLNITDVATSASGQTAIAYLEQTTLGLDYGFDAKKFGEPNTVALYSLAENTPLSVQARPAFADTDVVPMGFTAPAAGTYTISLDHVSGGFTQGQTIYLRDNSTGIITALNSGSYTFSSEAGTANNRFDVLYNIEALGTQNPTLDANTVAVFKQGNAIQINTGSVLMNGVTVYDIRGRKVYSLNDINNTQTAITNLTAEQQVLIVEVNTVKGKVSKRIVF